MSATPEMIAAAWAAWHSRHGGKLGPGPAFVEAINAAFAVCPSRLAGLREAAEVARGSKSYDDNLQKSAGCYTAGERIAAAILTLATVKETP